MTAWEKEKAYCARRAEQLGAEMDEAIEAGDRDSFSAAYRKALRYMPVKERRIYYVKWLRKGANQNDRPENIQ